MSEPNENIPEEYALAIARSGDGLKPWQKFLFDHIPEQGHFPPPDYIHNIHGIWQAKDWEHIASDTVHCNGTQMAAKLSILYKPKVIVEMGVLDGKTTLIFCKLNPQARIYGVDLNSRILRPTLQTVPTGFTVMMQNVKNLTLHFGDNSWNFSMPGKVDLCYIDADHSGDAPYKDSLCAWDNRNKDGDWCIAWDDYHPNNPDVKNAVDKFVKEVDMPLWKIGSWFYIGTKEWKED